MTKIANANKVRSKLETSVAKKISCQKDTRIFKSFLICLMTFERKIATFSSFQRRKTSYLVCQTVIFEKRYKEVYAYVERYTRNLF